LIREKVSSKQGIEILTSPLIQNWMVNDCPYTEGAKSNK